MTKDRPETIALIEKEARAIFDHGSWLPKETTLARFGVLGAQLGYDVAAHGKGLKYGEWLYDMSWSEMQPVREGSFFGRQVLVLETESAPDPHLDGDFQKLVQARAEVRVWIAKVKPQQSVEKHVATCKEQIKRFEGTMPTDIYIFLIYDSSEKAAVFEYFEAGAEI